MNRTIQFAIALSIMLLVPHIMLHAQFVLYIGSDNKADKAQRETTSTLELNLELVIDLQKKISQAEERINLELREQESFLMKRYPSEKLIDAYVKNNPLVKEIFRNRFENQQKNLDELCEQIKGWKYAPLFQKSIENIRSDMEDVKEQWKQATEISGNNNRMTNAQRNSLMEQTFARFKQICVTTQQLRTTIKGASMKDADSDIKSNAGSNGQ